MTQGPETRSREVCRWPWAVVVLTVVAGAALFWIAGDVWFDFAEMDASAGPWSWLASAGILLCIAGFLAGLVLTSNVLVRRHRASILPTTRLRQIIRRYERLT